MVTKKNSHPESRVTVSVNGNVEGNIVVGDGNTANSQVSQKSRIKDKETFFDAGVRLRQVREEIGLKSSEFIELLDLQSEKQYLAMERQTEEVPLSLLKKIHDVTGASLEWLKHEKMPRYERGEIYLNPIEDGLEYCESLNPVEYFFTLEPKSLHAGLVAQTGRYRYIALETGVILDFWEWELDHWAISAFYRFLKALSDPWHGIDGIILNPSDDKKLYSGAIHFRAITGKRNRSLLYDILDIDETRGGASNYSRRYGDWMYKVHDAFREFLNAE